MLRKVKVFKAGAIDSETLQPSKELDYVGEFHGFQQQTEFTAVGMIVSPLAIVEKPSGEVETVFLRNLQFVKQDNRKWIDWNPGSPPIAPMAIVDVFYDTGDEDTGRADSFDWEVKGFGIAKYRIIG